MAAIEIYNRKSGEVVEVIECQDKAEADCILPAVRNQMNIAEFGARVTRTVGEVLADKSWSF